MKSITAVLFLGVVAALMLVEASPQYDPTANPCRDACGINADCRVDSNNPYKAICSCPRGYYGHPFQECRKPTPEEEKASLCSPNPCGTNAVCQAGYDNTGKDRPVCTCPPGYGGNALVHCRFGECISDSECGSNARCESRGNGGSACVCPPGYSGEPKYNCFRIYLRGDSNNLSRSNAYKK